MKKITVPRVIDHGRGCQACLSMYGQVVSANTYVFLHSRLTPETKIEYVEVEAIELEELYGEDEVAGPSNPGHATRADTGSDS